jgi:hypothetical protein
MKYCHELPSRLCDLHAELHPGQTGSYSFGITIPGNPAVHTKEEDTLLLLNKIIENSMIQVTLKYFTLWLALVLKC